MILKSAQIKRVFYPESPSGRDVTILTDYEEEISRIKMECADRIIQWIHGFGVELLHYDENGDDIDPEPALRAVIIGGEE